MPSITINFSSEQADRISVGVQEALHMGNPATAADVKQYIINDLKQLVRNGERLAAERAARESIEDVDFT